MCRSGRAGRVASAILIVLSILLVGATGAWAGQPLQATVDTNSVSVSAGSAEVFEYRYGDVPFKPYIKELFTPNGLNVLLDAPHDHLHHHALMFAVAVDGVNFWEETPAAGRQRHDSFAGSGLTRRSRSWVGFTERIHWVDAAGQRLLDEQRAIRVRQAAQPQAVLLTWQSRLSVPEGEASVTLSGSHYFGLGMRFIRAMDEKGQFSNADRKAGTVFRGEERLVRSNWCAYTAPVDGQDVTVAMLGHPDNARNPTTWFTMATPFAYMAATLGLHEEPLVVPSGRPLTLRHGVALWDGRVEAAEIDAMYQKWVAQESVLFDDRGVTHNER